jgi:hypothetical protein
MKKLITILALTSLPLYAQDFGNLIPQDYFSITNQITTIKNEADVPNYEVKKSPEKDEYKYKPISIKTPRKGSLKKAEFKLTVDREAGKVSRITSVNFSNEEKGMNQEMAQSTSLDANGIVTSRTFCSNDFKINFLGFKKRNDGFKCVTVNPSICDYLTKNKIEEELAGKIKECSDLLGKLNKYQKDLHNFAKKDHAKDVRALGRINENLGNAKSFYELESSTLNDVADISVGYSSAIEQCNFLKTSNYLPEEPNEEPSHSGKPAKPAKSSKQ